MNDFNSLVTLIHETKDKALLHDLLNGLTTAKERQELPQRVEIVKRLIAGQSQHQIASELGVGVATVTRGSKELQAGAFKVLRTQNA